MEFELKIIPPTVTHQEKKVAVVRGKPVFYESERLKAARRLFEAKLHAYIPETPISGPIALEVEWRFLSKSHKEGEWRITRPDTDNLQKLLKDCMTKVGFWNDDAQVCSETITKRWTREKPGISIKVVSMDER